MRKARAVIADEVCGALCTPKAAARALA